MEREEAEELFDKWCKKLRIVPDWDVKLEWVEELTKCFLLEYGENKEFSFGRCKQQKSFTDLYEGLNSIK